MDQTTPAEEVTDDNQVAPPGENSEPDAPSNDVPDPVFPDDQNGGTNSEDIPNPEFPESSDTEAGADPAP